MSARRNRPLRPFRCDLGAGDHVRLALLRAYMYSFRKGPTQCFLLI
jgi:hypothetical protein